MLSIIVAIAKNNAIGKDNKLLWHISDDLKRFKSITSGKTMIMGRKTVQSLPGILPNRKHIIITRDNKFFVDNKNVETVNDLTKLVDKYTRVEEEVFVIGGADIYCQFIPYCDKLYLTIVDKEFDGDTFFPHINYDDWILINKSEKYIDEKSGLGYYYMDFYRKH